MMPNRRGMWSSGCLLLPITDAKAHATKQSAPAMSLMSIISSNWRTAARTVKAICKSFVGGSVTKPKAEFVILQDATKVEHVGIWLDGRSVLDRQCQEHDEANGKRS